MKWFIKAMRQYADFKGRARRKEYWMFYMFSVIFSILATSLDYVCGTNYYIIYDQGVGYGYIWTAVWLALFVPSLAVSVRRLHDTGKSGWGLFLSLIPIAGAIVLLVYFCTDGDPGENEYGPDPKAVAEPEVKAE